MFPFFFFLLVVKGQWDEVDIPAWTCMLIISLLFTNTNKYQASSLLISLRLQIRCPYKSLKGFIFHAITFYRRSYKHFYTKSCMNLLKGYARHANKCSYTALVPNKLCMEFISVLSLCLRRYFKHCERWQWKIDRQLGNPLTHTHTHRHIEYKMHIHISATLCIARLQPHPPTAPHQTVIDCWQVVFEETTGNFHDSLREGRWSRRECVVVATNGVVLICELCIFATFSHCWQLDLPQVAHATTTLCKVALAEALRNFGFTDSWCRAENNKPNTHRHASNIYVCVWVWRLAWLN